LTISLSDKWYILMRDIIFDKMKTPTSLYFGSDPSAYLSLKKSLEEKSKWILLTDDNSTRLCLEIFLQKLDLKPDAKFSLLPGEAYKNLWQVEKLYNYLLENGLDRSSAIVNLGGGLVSDLGGYAAATFKRGIMYYNVPTSLLSMVDAAFGGKTGINLGGVKNQIGSFHHPALVLFDEEFLDTLPENELKSGYAEILKHALVANSDFWNVLNRNSSIHDISDWHTIIQKSVEIKMEIVSKDPIEKSERKKLNFGHTSGHAIETFFNRSGRQVSHGHSVAVGMIIEAKLSEIKGLLKERELEIITAYINKIFEKLSLAEEDVSSLLSLMKYDKKNENENINFTLITEIGKVVIDQKASHEEIKSAIEYYLN